MTDQPTRQGTNVALIREVFAAFNANDLQTCISRLAPDFVMNMAGLPQPLHGREVWLRGAEEFKRGFPDIQGHIDDIFGAEDRVAVRLTFRGTHAGTFEGIPATGHGVEYISHEFYRITGDLIAEEWICSDTTTLLRQLAPTDS
jgi:steroid delta-isomerase-like uncharacterized protein